MTDTPTWPGDVAEGRTGPHSDDLFRVYTVEECAAGSKGYPAAWHSTIKHAVRELAGHRCVRCLHPYEEKTGRWSPCDERCTHQGDGEWRILTVHHLNGDKADCRWGNLASLCQRCHLQIQGKVLMGRVYPFEHSEWFKPYAAWWYALAYLGLELTREQVAVHQEQLLALELMVDRVASPASRQT